ncbi:MAG: hypothetical protein ACYS32_11330 [Planctomycetota bacterium]|jgi:hypothetical protein
MNLVKWFRKNRTKVMAVVVIVILFGFIGGSTFLSFISKRSSGLHKTVAYFGDNRKITNYDIATAREELQVLQQAGAGELLRNIGVPLFQTPDLRTLMLGELLFSERGTSAGLINFLKRTIRTGDFRISDKQISDLYKRTVPTEIYWHCLKKEAELTGFRVSNEDTRNLLINAMPQIPQFNKATYFQVISSVAKRAGITEEKILTTYGKLLAVLEYAKVSCSGEDVTTAQVMHAVSREGETIDANFVKIDSAVFADTQSEPNQDQIIEHFNKYKKFFARETSGENPYGFGYKLLDRVQLEYIACQIDDVSKIVTPPTDEETEAFYQKNREQFTEEVLSDPNDPNSPLIERIKDYAEVAGVISKGLLKNKISAEAKNILDEAKAITEGSLQDIDNEAEKLSLEQLKQKAGDYKAAAEELSEKYKIRVYTGKTGLLTADSMQVDDHLGRLFLRGYGQTVLGLTQIVFAIEELGISELGPFDASKPGMYKNIGPLSDMLERIIAVVRVIDAEKASEPESIDQTFSTNTLKLEQVDEADPNRRPDEDSQTDEVFSVKEKVTEDLKRLAAMGVTKKKAEEFIAMAAKDGWESSIDKFNELYGQDDGDPNESADPNTMDSPDRPFKLENNTGLRRISRQTMEKLAVQSEGNPGAPLFVNEAQQWLSVNEAQTVRQFIDQIYTFVPPDSNSIENVPQPMEFKPGISYYCLKDVRVRRVFREDYEQVKPIQVFKEEHIQFQSLAIVHFNPENILKRVNFRSVREGKQATDANTPAEPGEVS